MKKVWILLLLGLVLLFGCASHTVETVSDVYVTQPPAEKKTISVQLPEEATEAVMEGADGTRLYLCDGYELRLQTVSCSGLDAALQSVTGFGEDRLTVMKTKAGELSRYDCVWCTAGEGGEQIGRTTIFHDGDFYYCISALADSAVAYDLSPVWQQILGSVTLS